jgi:pSer/pThr/pTyr-binding forkhead associated (FHA) protein
MAYLQLESDDLQGQRYEIGADPVTIGRTEDNTIILDDTEVSSHHCQVLQEGELSKIEDLDSTNGTRLNDVPVRQSLLQDGDVVTVGSFSFTYRGGDASTEPSAVDSMEAALPEPVAQAKSVPMFKPKPRTDLVRFPVILLLVTCAASAAAFYLNRLFNY